jgi:hypothetical protein
MDTGLEPKALQAYEWIARPEGTRPNFTHSVVFQLTSLPNSREREFKNEKVKNHPLESGEAGMGKIR